MDKKAGREKGRERERIQLLPTYQHIRINTFSQCMECKMAWMSSSVGKKMTAQEKQR